MSEHQNTSAQPIGFPLPNWTPRPLPPRTAMIGRTCRVEPIDVGRHAAELFEANRLDAAGTNWTYLGSGPFDDFAGYRDWLAKISAGGDPMFHAIIDGASNQA